MVTKPLGWREPSDPGYGGSAVLLLGQRTNGGPMCGSKGLVSAAGSFFGGRN